jgi:hypothetical protein
MRSIGSLIVILLIVIVVKASWGQSFVTYDLRVNGAIITVITADLRGSRRQDLVVISRTGSFPREARWVSVFWQQEGGHFNPHADLAWEMDPQATVIDVGPLDSESARQSLVYLTGSEVRAYQFSGPRPPTSTTLLKIPTLTVFPEPVDLPRLPLIHDW